MECSLSTAVRKFTDTCRKNGYKLKPYLIKDGDIHPVALICPGGGYSRVCSFVEGYPFAKKLNELGYHAVVVYYRVKNRARFPAPQDDLARAVREVIANQKKWNLDVTDYSVWGSSAGGHLVATFGSQSIGYAKYGLPRPGALVLCYPVVTMTECTHGGSRDNLLGKEPAEQMIQMTSVENLVTAQYPPTFLWWGDNDATVDPRNSRMLRTALQKCGVPCICTEYTGVGHGVGLGKGLSCEGWLERAAAFWELHRR